MSLKAGRPSNRTSDHIDKSKQDLIDDDEEKRLNVRMKKSEYKKLKQYALDNDLTVSDVVKNAVFEYMNK